MLSSNKFYFVCLCVCVLLIRCSKVKTIYHIQPSIIVLDSISSSVSEEKLKNWHHKDIVKDKVPGISLDKAYAEFPFSNSENDIIVAVIDTEIDINHEDLKNQIWINTEEIPSNGIDDDDNGYIDDIHGWNFLGNGDKNIIYSNYEVVRIIREYQDRIEDKKEK